MYAANTCVLPAFLSLATRRRLTLRPPSYSWNSAQFPFLSQQLFFENGSIYDQTVSLQRHQLFPF